MVNIEDFIADQLRTISAFTENWIDSHKIEPGGFPLELSTMGDWDEQFLAFRGRTKE